jgi:hypothetical protein
MLKVITVRLRGTAHGSIFGFFGSLSIGGGASSVLNFGSGSADADGEGGEESSTGLALGEDEASVEARLASPSLGARTLSPAMTPTVRTTARTGNSSLRRTEIVLLL